MRIWRTIRAGIGGIIPAGLALLLTLQFALMHVPPSTAQGSAGAEVVICADGGFQTITLDLSDGSPQERPVAAQGAKCPLCIVGAVLLFDQPARACAAAEFHPVRYPLASRVRPHPERPVQTRAIRAPPLTV
ncbi:DUF2946 family protein [Antarcticimicrobium sediminis]|uniref:DUF2946 family protein n=1 Tax=Antarcticimicrobium sediminis TaxID=2546227 RepID=UPI003CCAE2C6